MIFKPPVAGWPLPNSSFERTGSDGDHALTRHHLLAHRVHDGICTEVCRAGTLATDSRCAGEPTTGEVITLTTTTGYLLRARSRLRGDRQCLLQARFRILAVGRQSARGGDGCAGVSPNRDLSPTDWSVPPPSVRFR
jgi:hypothetical protein